MYEIVSLILIVFGILQIILFFKIWKMTNNVSAIAKKMQCSNDVVDEMRKMLIKGETEKAYDYLCDRMVEDLISLPYDNKFSDFGQFKEYYKKHFGMIGRELPSYTEKCKTMAELSNLYN